MSADAFAVVMDVPGAAGGPGRATIIGPIIVPTGLTVITADIGDPRFCGHAFTFTDDLLAADRKIAEFLQFLW